MIHVTAGTDTYGRVKAVRGTPVVTKFAMLQFVPLYPLESFYFSGSGKARKGGVPFLVSSHETVVRGIPLAHLDKTSVIIAYLRGICAVLVTLGFLCFLFVIDTYYYENQMDEVQMAIYHVMLTMFVVGTVGGLLTYALPVMSKRERDIRLFCGELLGMGVYPALVAAEQSRWMDVRAGSQSLPDGRTNQLLTRNDCMHELISVRAWIAQGLDTGHLEAKTDELLERLNYFPIGQKQ